MKFPLKKCFYYFYFISISRSELFRFTSLNEIEKGILKLDLTNIFVAKEKSIDWSLILIESTSLFMKETREINNYIAHSNSIVNYVI